MQSVEIRVCYAGSAVAIGYGDAPSARIVEFLFRDAPSGGHVPPHVSFHLSSAGPGDRFMLRQKQAGSVVNTGGSAAVVAEILLGETCHALADRSQGGVLFHAAALAWGGQGLLLPGTIAAGKTTLALWLARRGFQYLTDEMAFVPCGAGHFQPFTRPLNLKHPSREVLRDSFDFERHAAHILSAPGYDLVSPRALDPHPPPAQARLSRIVFPRYRPGDFSFEPLTPAQAGLALMECLTNARNLPDHGFPEVARLAQAVPTYRMTYGSFAQIAETLEGLF